MRSSHIGQNCYFGRNDKQGDSKMVEKVSDSPPVRVSVPLTRFHNNTGEFLDLALTQPVTLTKHERVVLTICEAGYFERLEAFAATRGGPVPPHS
jgi:hypothetical protein